MNTEKQMSIKSVPSIKAAPAAQSEKNPRIESSSSISTIENESNVAATSQGGGISEERLFSSNANSTECIATEPEPQQQQQQSTGSTAAKPAIPATVKIESKAGSIGEVPTNTIVCREWKTESPGSEPVAALSSAIPEKDAVFWLVKDFSAFRSAAKGTHSY